MIEIILRSDVTVYEPKPIFGHTYRQVATFAVLLVACVAAGVGLWSVGAPQSVSGPLIVSLGALVGYMGMGKPGGLRAEQWLRIWLEDSRWPRVSTLSPVRVQTASDRQAARQGQGRRRKARKPPIETEIDARSL